MPRRTKAAPLALAVGRRIRQLRTAAGLTLERLAYETNSSKGHLSSIEAGLVMPTIATLAVLAEGLDVELFDLTTFPDEGERSQLVDLTRTVGRDVVRGLLRQAKARNDQA